MAVGAPMKGMLVGGVNQNLEDNAALAYCIDSPPAKCWVDNSESYSTNEITIYWNSPLTYLLSLTEKAENNEEQDPTEPILPTDPTNPPVIPGVEADLYGDANCDGKVTIADATAILQSLGNPDKYNLSEQGAANADVDGSVGVTAADAVTIQKLDAKLISSLPVTE
jgi:endoglucanase